MFVSRKYDFSSGKPMTKAFLSEAVPHHTGGGQKCLSCATGVDLYNHQITGDKAMTLCCVRMDAHHMPCVIIQTKENINDDLTTAVF